MRRIIFVGLLVIACGCDSVNYRTWWEDAPAPITKFDAPPKAIVGTQVPITATVVIGSSSCNRVLGVTANVEHASRSVLLSGLKQTQRSNQNMACSADVRAEKIEVLFTPQTTGIYHLTSPNNATHDIEVLPVGAQGAEWWVEDYADVRGLTGPESATVDQPVSVTARVEVGDSGCARLGNFQATVRDDHKIVYVWAMRSLLKSPLPLPCTGEIKYQDIEVRFTPKATGNYSIMGLISSGGMTHQDASISIQVN